MKEDIEFYATTPAGSLINLSGEERFPYLVRFFALPPALRNVALSVKTGAFIRGLLKTHDIALDKAPILAFAVLNVLLGNTGLANLPQSITQLLKISQSIADRIAKEIEKELFAPIALEFNQYLAQKGKGKVELKEEKRSIAPARPIAKPAVNSSAPTPPSWQPPRISATGKIVTAPSSSPAVKTTPSKLLPPAPKAPSMPNLIDLKQQQSKVPPPPPIPRPPFIDKK